MGSFTILLVEDDFDVREALAETLRDEGYAVECAVDGVQALDYLRGGGRPGLILLDLMMPRMSGSEFRMVQKVDPQLADLPVVLISADGRWRRRRARSRPTARSASPSMSTSCWLDVSSASIEKLHEPAQQPLRARRVRERQLAAEQRRQPAEQRVVLDDGLDAAELRSPSGPWRKPVPLPLMPPSGASTQK